MKDEIESGAYKDVDGNLFELLSVALMDDIQMCVYMDGEQMRVMPADEWTTEIRVPRFRKVD